MWKYEKMKIKQELKHDSLHYKCKQWLFCVTGGVRQGRSLPLQCVTRLVPAAKQHTCNSELNNGFFHSPVLNAASGNQSTYLHSLHPLWVCRCYVDGERKMIQRCQRTQVGEKNKEMQGQKERVSRSEGRFHPTIKA